MKMVLFPSKEVEDLFFSDINFETECIYRCLNPCFKHSHWDEYVSLTKDGKFIKDGIDAMMKDESSIVEREDRMKVFDWTGTLIIENESYVDESLLPQWVISAIFVWELPIVRGYFDIKRRKLITSTYKFHNLEP